MPRTPRKAPFQCPGCGFVQFEPPRLISTYCRGCGDFYSVGETPRETLSAEVPAQPLPFKEVHCHRCGGSHAVPLHAVSTLCSHCSSAIEFGDMAFLSPASRAVDTRGKLHIGPLASLSSSWIVCGSAEIEGRITGVLRCEGEVRLSVRNLCACRIVAASVVIERPARMTLALPVETGHLEVLGHLRGIINCRGDVHVRRGGRLEAVVHARSVKVDKGGALIGACHVDVSQPEEAVLPPAGHDPQFAWHGQLCHA